MRILSLGWGVQSWTLAAMIALGDLPSVDYAVHADTGWERESTYEFAARWTSWLQAHGMNIVTLKPKNNGILNGYGFVQIPAFTNGYGQLKRQCTSNWKIIPVRQFVAGELKKRGAKKSAGIIEMWLGITTDEWRRAKDSNVQYIKHIYPLLDNKMSRNDCINYLNVHALPVPPKSSCSFCPFHSLEAWQEMKRARGADWEQVIEIDEFIRTKRPPDDLYLLRNCIPVAQLPIPEDYGYKQSSFLDDEDISCDSGYCFM